MESSTLPIMVFGIMFVGGGLMIMSHGLQRLSLHRRAQTWPTVEAWLEKCEIVSDRKQYQTFHDVAVQYGYRVDGVDYLGNTYSTGYTTSIDRAAIEERCSRIRAMRPLVVRYDPDTPESSVMLVAERAGAFGLFFFGLPFFLFGTFIPMLHFVEG